MLFIFSKGQMLITSSLKLASNILNTGTQRPWSPIIWGGVLVAQHQNTTPLFRKDAVLDVARQAFPGPVKSGRVGGLTRNPSAQCKSAAPVPTGGGLAEGFQ